MARKVPATWEVLWGWLMGNYTPITLLASLVGLLLAAFEVLRLLSPILGSASLTMVAQRLETLSEPGLVVLVFLLSYLLLSSRRKHNAARAASGSADNVLRLTIAANEDLQRESRSLRAQVEALREKTEADRDQWQSAREKELETFHRERLELQRRLLAAEEAAQVANDGREDLKGKLSRLETRRPTHVVMKLVASVDTSVTNDKPSHRDRLERYEVTVQGRLTMRMVFIPTGVFRMGIDHNDTTGTDRRRAPWSEYNQFPPHEVELDAYYISELAFTNENYRAYMEDTGNMPPSHFTEPTLNRPEQPILGLSWQAAMEFSAWAGTELPTEAEWECADRLLHFREGFVSQGARDGRWEWCADWYDQHYYSRSPRRNPVCAEASEAHVVRISQFSGYSNHEPPSGRSRISVFGYNNAAFRGVLRLRDERRDHEDG
jgi:formylglycine-generating enzyme required for sulfatase activity